MQLNLEMTWFQAARDRIFEDDARLKELQDEALSDLDKYTHHNY